MGIQIKHEHLNNDICGQLTDLLYEFRDVFATKILDLTGPNIIQCHIETHGKLFRIRPYRLSPDVRKHVDKQVQELLNAKIIAPSDASRWCSPIVMVRKPSGEFRFCADLRRLNSQCETLYHELPNVEDVVDLVSQNQAKIFTVCDLRQAFYQLSLTDESSEKTTFSVSHGNFYKFLKLPMGYANSPYHCTQALNKLFRHQIGDYVNLC